MTVSELVAAVMEQAEDVNNVPMDETEKLARKIASAADAAGIVPAAVDLHTDTFTEEERGLATAAVIERAERHMQAASAKSSAKAKKINDSRRYPILPKREDGWYFDNSESGDETVPECGPYPTKQECNEARISLINNNIRNFPPKELAKAEAKSRARKSGTGATKASEPKAAKTVTPQTEGNESEEPVKTDHPKKKGGKPAKAKGTAAGNGKAKADKPAKAAKAKKDPGEKKMSALDAAYEVLKNRTVPMTARELIEVMAMKKLWESPGGKTPDATLAAALVREINGKGKDSRFAKPEAGKFSAK